MGAKFLPAELLAPQWRLITVSEDVSFEVLIQRPPIKRLWENIIDERSGYQVLLDDVIDWRGVTDLQDQPVPFTRENLYQLLQTYRTSLLSVLEAVRDVTEGTSPKNFELPPQDGGMATIDETTVSTD